LLTHCEMKKYKPDKFFINIPFDDNRNYISDAWEYDEGKDPKEDEDDDPHSDNYKGDGLSRYDEYRGFFTQEGYIRTNPNHKDVFVYDPDKLGIGYFSLTNLHIILNPIPNDDRRVTEYDTTAHIYNQFYITLRKAPYHSLWIYNPEGVQVYICGRTNTALGAGEAPICDIDDQLSKERYYGEKGLSYILAHELGHAVSLFEHYSPWSGREEYYAMGGYPPNLIIGGQYVNFCIMNPDPFYTILTPEGEPQNVNLVPLNYCPSCLNIIKLKK